MSVDIECNLDHKQCVFLFATNILEQLGVGLTPLAVVNWCFDVVIIMTGRYDLATQRQNERIGKPQLCLRSFD